MDQRLRGAYETADLGNKDDPLDELIFIQLSIRTREDAYARIFAEIEDAVEGVWERFLDTPESQLLEIMESGGMARVKVRRLKEQLRAIRDRFGEVTLSPLCDWPTKHAEDFLLSLPGVGPKAARCVLLYSLGRKVFPVDSHCRRVMRRLGLLDQSVGRKAAHDALQELVPPDIMHSLHVNLVHHGRSICTPEGPVCESCPILDLCPTGQSRAESSKDV